MSHENFYMVLEDGTKVLLEIGRCYGTFNYDNTDANTDNRLEADGVYSSVWDSFANTDNGVPETEMFCHIETQLGRPLRLRELVISEYVKNLKIWAGVTIEKPVILPEGLEFAYLSTNAVYSNLDYYCDSDVDIVLCSDDLTQLSGWDLLSYNSLTEKKVAIW